MICPLPSEGFKKVQDVALGGQRNQCVARDRHTGVDRWTTMREFPPNSLWRTGALAPGLMLAYGPVCIVSLSACHQGQTSYVSHPDWVPFPRGAAMSLMIYAPMAIPQTAVGLDHSF